MRSFGWCIQNDSFCDRGGETSLDRLHCELQPNLPLSMHIRRNDLQFKEAFIGAQEMMQNVGQFLPEKTTLYIATDETVS